MIVKSRFRSPAVLKTLTIFRRHTMDVRHTLTALTFTLLCTTLPLLSQQAVAQTEYADETANLVYMR